MDDNEIYQAVKVLAAQSDAAHEPNVAIVLFALAGALAEGSDYELAVLVKQWVRTRHNDLLAMRDQRN